MKFYSTGNRSERTDFRTAVLQGLAPDGGLYMPESLPRPPGSFWLELKGESITRKAHCVFDLLLKEDFTPEQRKEIAENAFTFDAPLISLEEDLHILELFHGPTLAFKDFGARTMASILSILAREQNDRITIITATSGDTGAAVAHGFHKAQGVDVFILYPGGQITPFQEKQFTTLGDNITALEVEGTFDDCQRLVKACFADKDLRKKKRLTTANSINIARLLPQMIYYIHAVTEMMPSGREEEKILCSVPSGNFGNLTAGLFAGEMGLPIAKFVAATNVNHVVPDYLNNGIYRPKPSMRTISNAMDVGNPSNFDRMLDLYDHDHQKMSKIVKGAWFDDDQTGNAIKEVWRKFRYLMDPHTAVGYLGSLKHKKTGEKTLVPATAHPAKFPETITKLVPGALKTPGRLSRIIEKEKNALPVPADINAVKELILGTAKPEEMN